MAAALMAQGRGRPFREAPGGRAHAEHVQADGVVEQFGAPAAGQGEHRLRPGDEPFRVDVAHRDGEPLREFVGRP
ncbi:hypothetical protein AT728_07075 [Streptomyces silvensis]|uniref:Uncharacterized protein n=1 Tax=Streptomyces silvensis TaxID=1765722 RepID=A0A0W7X7G8_9ACTN|nr:hypothetical protein AT728_07075 [Streptomyces silvensis]